jgi:hypothetical protein
MCTLIDLYYVLKADNANNNLFDLTQNQVEEGKIKKIEKNNFNGIGKMFLAYDD